MMMKDLRRFATWLLVLIAWYRPIRQQQQQLIKHKRKRAKQNDEAQPRQQFIIKKDHGKPPFLTDRICL
jgi:hypothetical protein